MLALQWDARITMLSIPEPMRDGEQALARARCYLDARRVQADYLLKPGQPAQAILSTTRERACDLILIGGYGHCSCLMRSSAAPSTKCFGAPPGRW